MKNWIGEKFDILGDELLTQRTPKQIAKDMILSAISGRMEELISDDLPDNYSDTMTKKQMDEVERHLRNYLNRLYNFVK